MANYNDIDRGIYLGVLEAETVTLRKTFLELCRFSEVARSFVRNTLMKTQQEQKASQKFTNTPAETSQAYSPFAICTEYGILYREDSNRSSSSPTSDAACAGHPGKLSGSYGRPHKANAGQVGLSSIGPNSITNTVKVLFAISTILNITSGHAAAEMAPLKVVSKANTRRRLVHVLARKTSNPSSTRRQVFFHSSHQCIFQIIHYSIRWCLSRATKGIGN